MVRESSFEQRQTPQGRALQGEGGASAQVLRAERVGPAHKSVSKHTTPLDGREKVGKVSECGGSGIPQGR